MRTSAFASLLLLAGSAIAHADPADGVPAPPTRESTYDFGIRVGGYGFKRAGTQEWDVCRMQGFGIFAGRKLDRIVFLEAGLDVYSSVPIENMEDLPIDRSSGIFTAAVGMRTSLFSWMRFYGQIGAGLELTTMSVPYGDREISDSRALPMGFAGLGLEVKLGRRNYVGLITRTNVMGNFDYDPKRLDMTNTWVSSPTAEQVFDPSPQLSAQGQFYLRRDL